MGGIMAAAKIFIISDFDHVLTALRLRSIVSRKPLFHWEVVR